MSTWRGRSAEQWVGAMADAGREEPRDLVPSLGAVSVLAETIQAAHAQRKRAQRAKRAALYGVPMVLAAAGIALWWGHSSSSSELAEVRRVERDVHLIAGAASMPLAAGRALRAGEELTTGAASGVTLAMLGGSVELAEYSELSLAESPPGHQVSLARLGRGSVKVALPKLEAGSSFSVATPDAKVTVVGTRFDVRVIESASGPVTCVRVEQGRVRVESSAHQAILSAGQSWVSRGDLEACGAESSSSQSPRQEPSTDSAPPAAAPEVASPDVTLPEVASPEHRKSSTRARPASSVERAGTLAEENRLFLELVQARREQRLPEARQLQQQFLERYPSSALAEQVREEAFKSR